MSSPTPSSHRAGQRAAGSPAPTAADLLRDVPAFAALSAQAREQLAARCELRTFRTGAPLVPPDGRWSGLGVVLSGTAQLLDERHGSIAIDTLAVGAVFGHESLLSDQPFPYNAYATSDCTALILARAAFDDWLSSRPALLHEMRESASRSERRTFLAGSMLATVLDPGSIESAAAAMREFNLAPGETLVTEGRPATEVFVVRAGRLRVTQGGGDPLAWVETGDIVDETGTIPALARQASLIAETECRIYAVAADVFRALSVGQKTGRMDALIAAGRRSEPDSSQGDSPAEEEAAAVLRWTEPEYRPPPPRFPWLKRYPSVRQQSSMDCGAACLATICRYYGKRVSLNRMRALARVGTSGASMLHLMHAAREIGFEAVPILSTLEHLKSSHLPALINWKGYHWIVVYAVNETRVTVADPGGGVMRIPVDEFVKSWTRYTLFMRPTPRFAEFEESRPTLAQFWPYLTPHRRTLFELGAASLTIQLLAMLFPLFTKFVIDEVIVPERPRWLAAAVAGLIAAVLLQWAVAWARQRLLIAVSYRVNLKLITDFYRHVLRLPLPFFEHRRVGDIVSRLDENTKITSFFTTTGVEFFIDSTTALLYFGLMLYYNVWLTSIAAMFFVLHFVNIYVLTPRLQQGYRELFERGAELESHNIEALSGLRTIRTLGVEHYIRATWENLFARATNAYFGTLKYGIASGLASEFVNLAGSVAVLFFGARLVLQGEVTVGALVAFTVLAQGVMQPITKLVGSWDQLQETLNAVERLNDVYESPAEATDEPGNDLVILPAMNGHVQFEDVTFRYDPEGRNVLQNIDLDIHAGQRVAFVGRSGSGKSTLVKLLLGFYRPTTGRILVDGFDLTDVWLPSLRRQIGVVPQSSFLFHGTVRDNIAQGRPDATAADVEWAATMAHAHEFIVRLPQGYQTVLAEQAKTLSGGQRQRIAIARAILQQPRMILLDEATSALDNESERRFMQNFEAAFPRRTVLMIAHRLSTVRHADLIVVLDRGTIIEQGTHDELMASRGLYYFISTQQLNL
jgi:HlyB family type I secretion system ABC transporter